METGVQLLPAMRFRSAHAAPAAIAADRPSAETSLEPEAQESMDVKPNPLRAVLAGLLLTLAQLFVAVVLLAPEGPLSYRYSTLVQHDSYWFANIIDRGYDTILPPMARKMMEVSNVAFFPAYPAIAGALHHWAGLSTYDALLVTAQAAAWGFWSYFFLFCDRWNVRPMLQLCGAITVLAHPTAFFLVAAYSESLFLMALLGFIYWSSAEGRTAKVIAGLHGILMSATRIVGLPIALFPLVRAACQHGWQGVLDMRGWVRRYTSAIALSFVAMLGGIGFFLYCLLRWGRWDLYMQTQESGWAVRPDYLAIFKLESYRWLVPPLDDPTLWSQMTMTFGAICFLVVALGELVPAIRRQTGWQTRVGIYFGAFLTYYIAVSGVASVQMESMLRYQFCAHALVVLALMHFLTQFRPLPTVARGFAMATVALLCAAGLSLQGWWIWNFTRGGWVA